MEVNIKLNTLYMFLTNNFLNPVIKNKNQSKLFKIKYFLIM